MSEENESAEGVTYSRVLHVEGRMADDSPEHKKLMAIMRERAPDPSIFDEFTAYLFNGQISSTVWDSYDTQMAISTLKNYASEANNGVAFLRGHRSYSTDPIGYSLTGSFVGGQGNGVARVMSDWYVMRDPDSAVFVDRMRGGVVRDLSVGFYGGEWICSICKKDMDQWMLRDGCHHILGLMYQPRDECGMPKGEAVKCRATIENAHLSEYSGVFDGSTPGCMIAKARAMAAEGILRDGERELVEVRYRITLPAYAKPFPGVDAPATDERQAVGNTAEEENTTMADENEELKPATIRIADGLLTAEEVERNVRLVSSLRAALDESDLTKGKEPVEAVRGLHAEVTRLRAIEEGQVSIRALAEDGRTYRRDLIEGALKEGVRAMGDGFKIEEKRAFLEKCDLVTVKELSASWRALGDASFPGGRQTTDEAEEEKPAARKQPSNAAFKA